MSNNRATKGLNWSEDETREFLDICIEKNIIQLLEGKKHKHVDVFRSLVPEMALKQHDKTAQQLMLKLKNLKLAYFKAKRTNFIKGTTKYTCPFYKELDVLYGHRPIIHEISQEELVDIEVQNGSATESDSYIDNYVENTPSTSVNGSIKRGIKRSANFSGRKSYKNILDTYTEKWMDSHEKLMRKIMIEQCNMQQKLFQTELQKQKEWETELLEKERQFQREQQALLMQTFAECVSLIKPTTGPSFQDLLIIPANCDTIATELKTSSPQQAKAKTTND